MSCVEQKSGRYTNMAKLGQRQHKSIPGHQGFVKPGKVVVSHAGQQGLGTGTGAKPQRYRDAKSAANALFNKKAQPPRETNRPDQIVAAGLTNTGGN